MVHLRIIAPGDEARKALELLTASPAVANVVHLPALARKPEGDMILCDVARPDASIIVEELRQTLLQKTAAATPAFPRTR